MAKGKTKQQTIEELRTHIQELEETLEAIRIGAVDAIVTSGPAGDRVYTLEGADHAYHVMVESMNEGAVTLSADGTILYGNQRFTQMAAASPSGIVGHRFHEFVSTSDHPILDAIIDKEGRDCPKTEIRLFNESAVEIPVQIAASPIELGGAKALTLVINDLSAQRRYEEIVAAENLSRRILEQAQEAIAVCIDGCIVRANRAFCEICGSFPLMQPFDLVFPLRISESEMFSIAIPESGKTIQNQQVRYHRPHGRIFNLILNAGPLVGKDSKVLGTLITLVDVTARKRQAAILDGINRIFKEAISSCTEEQLWEISLAVAGELTASPIGFIGEIGADGKLYDVTISNPGWDACRIPDRTGHRGSHEFKIHGLYGRVLREGKSFFTNDPSSEPDSIGLPPGHPPLASFLGVPLIREGRAIGLVAVGNREGGYGQEELDALVSLAPSIVEAFLRKRAEEALRESEERYRQLVDTAPDAIVVHRDGWYLFANEAALRLYGADDFEQLKSRNIVDLLHPDDRALTLSRIERVQAGERTALREARLLRLDGQEVMVEATAGPIYYGGNRAVQVILRDVTQRKKAEEALEKMRFMLSEGQRIAHVGSFEYVAATRTTVWSDEECRIYGLAPGMPSPAYDVMLEKFIHPDDAALLHETFTAAMKNRSIYELEHRIVRPDGSVRTVYDRAHPYFDEKGELVRYVGATLDITERKRAENLLRQSEERFRLIASSTPDHLLVQDRDLRYTLVINPQLGLTEQEMIGKTDHDFLSKEVADELTKIKRQVLETGHPVHLEIPLLSRKGEQEYFTGSYVPTYGADGRLDRLVGYFRNVTELKRAEEELRKERDFSTAVLDTAGALVVVLDKEGRITRFNRACEEITGYPAEEVLGRVFLEFLIPPEEAWDVRQAWNALRSGDFPNRHENHWVAKDGSRRLIAWSNTAITREDGSIDYIIGTGVDITERKQAEEEIRLGAAELEAVFTAQDDAVLVYDTEMNVKRANPALRTIYGFDPVGLNVRDVMRRASCRRLDGQPLVLEDQPTPLALRGHRVSGATFIVSRADGTDAVVETSSGPMYVGDHITGSVTVWHDITERMRTEENLRFSEEALQNANEFLEQRVRERTMELQNLAEQLDRSRGELRKLALELVMTEERERKRIAGVLHDEIAQTLAAARMRVDMIQGSPSDQKERMKEAKALLEQSIRETRSLMNDLGNPLLFDMGLQAACESLAEGLMKIHPVRIRCDIREAYKRLDPDVKTMLYQVVRELLNNVVKHSQAQNAHVAIDTENGTFRVKVTDDGVGFDLQALGAPTVESGFGLYSIRERLIAIDGSLRIESAPGNGTVVTAIVPTKMG